MMSPVFEHSNIWMSVGWTLVHFLWVGALLGVAVALVRRLVRGASPELRFAMALASFLLLLAAPFAIFAIVLQGATSHGPALGRSIAVADATVDAQLRSSLQRYIVWIPWLWFGGALIKHVGLFTGWLGTRRLRREARLVVDGDVSSMCRRLARSLGWSGSIRVGFSDRIGTPILLGILRPMILLPASLASGWAPERLEMILLHELAHLKRRDTLVVLLQRIGEALLFYHPVVWQVSRWVTLESEHCCDALVLSRTRRPHSYARTLVAMSGTMNDESLLGAAMADGHLVRRIRRILNQEETRMRTSPRTTIGAVMLLITSITVLSAYADKLCPSCQQVIPERTLVATIDEAPVAIAADAPFATVVELLEPTEPIESPAGEIAGIAAYPEAVASSPLIASVDSYPEAVASAPLIATIDSYPEAVASSPLIATVDSYPQPPSAPSAMAVDVPASPRRARVVESAPRAENPFAGTTRQPRAARSPSRYSGVPGRLVAPEAGQTQAGPRYPAAAGRARVRSQSTYDQGIVPHAPMARESVGQAYRERSAQSGSTGLRSRATRPDRPAYRERSAQSGSTGLRSRVTQPDRPAYRERSAQSGSTDVRARIAQPDRSRYRGPAMAPGASNLATGGGTNDRRVAPSRLAQDPNHVEGTSEYWNRYWYDYWQRRSQQGDTGGRGGALPRAEGLPVTPPSPPRVSRLPRSTRSL